MDALAGLAAFFGSRLAEWRDTSLVDLQFWQRDSAWLAAIAFILLSLTMAVLRTGIRHRSQHNRVGLPAILARFDRPSWAFVRHTPHLLLLAGLPFFLLALADPYTSLTQKRMAFPGRRICLMIDASKSMVSRFSAPTLMKQAQNSGRQTSQAAFYTTVAAAERFVRLRMESRYRDLMGLVEFGDHAYVVTPFTNDYNNILLSLSLIGDVDEFMRFPDDGTVIASAVDQGVRLFRAFDFLDAVGNIMVMFTDGEDSSVTAGKSVAQVVSEAVKAKVPVYFIRINYQSEAGSVIADTTWKAAVEKTGGRFYAAADEETILRAIRDIDRASVGQIDIQQYVTQRPRFGIFTLVAAAMWTMALALKLTVPYFRRFH